MNRVPGFLGLTVGRIARARRMRRLEKATRDLSDHDLKDIGFLRDWHGHLVPRQPE